MSVRYLILPIFLVFWGCESTSDDDTTPTAGSIAGGSAGEGGATTGGNAGDGGTTTGGSAGEGGSTTGGNAGEGGTTTGGSAGEGGSTTGGSAGEGGAMTGGSAGEGGTMPGGSAGEGGSTTTSNDCTNSGGVCRDGQGCEPGEGRIRSSCDEPETSCCLPNECPDADSDGICNDEDPYCSLDDVQVTCRALAPECPANQVPETSGGCYTGQCVAWQDCGGNERCNSSDDCPAGSRCDAGGCLPCPNNDCGGASEACGGIAGLECPGMQVCVDDPQDQCDPDRGGSDCIGICVDGCDPAQDHCGEDSWCRPIQPEGSGSICVPYAQENESCGGFRPPNVQERCAPDLACASINLMIADLPGRCFKPCNAGTPCSEGHYCAEDNVCRMDGTCLGDGDCNNTDNQYDHIACVGRGECGLQEDGLELVCGWNCQ